MNASGVYDCRYESFLGSKDKSLLYVRILNLFETNKTDFSLLDTRKLQRPATDNVQTGFLKHFDSGLTTYLTQNLFKTAKPLCPESRAAGFQKNAIFG